jgi:hypothetical protein
MKALTRMVVIGGAVLGAATGARAQSSAAVSLSGFDVRNRFGAPMSTFSAQYTHLSAGSFLALDPGSFSAVQINQLKDGVRLQWTDGAIDPGHVAHVGFSLDESPPARQEVIGYQFDPGTPPLAAASTQQWVSAGGGKWRDKATGECCFTGVQRTAGTTDIALTLPDMQPDGGLRLITTPVDPAPVLVPPEGLTFDYPRVDPNTWCIMIYDVYDMSTGDLIMSFCNAVRGRPCPADWDGNGVVNSTDVSNFINSWFEDQAAGTLVADWNGDGVSNSTDVSDFINSWFEDLNNGCGS